MSRTAFDGTVTLPAALVFDAAAWLVAIEELFARMEDTGKASIGADSLTIGEKLLLAAFGPVHEVEGDDEYTHPVYVAFRAAVNEHAAMMARNAARAFESSAFHPEYQWTERDLRLLADSADLYARVIREERNAWPGAPGVEDAATCRSSAGELFDRELGERSEQDDG